MKTNRTSSRPWIALVAAWLMLAQSVAGSFAATATHSALDAFGNPLCVTSTDHSQPSEDPHKLPGCCILGCGALASAFAAPADENWLEVTSSTEPAWQLGSAAPLILVPDEHDPGSPRAPPALV